MKSKPNILFIMTDQQHAGMLSCSGNPYVKTPNLDRLAENGTRFEKAYCTNPVCVPSRFSMMTGLFPSCIGVETVEDLDRKFASQDLLDQSMGHLFRNAGYRTVYGGKKHLPGPPGEITDDVRHYGFEYLTDDHRVEMAKSCADFIREPHDKPFLLVASFVNPHDICYMGINDYAGKTGKELIEGVEWDCLKEAMKIPQGVGEEEFYSSWCPPLPSNFEIPNKELSAFMADKPEFMRFVRHHWSEREWRLHRWAYANLTGLVDSEIGLIMNALRDAKLEENTLIIFTSDHGDQDGAHRAENKAFLYEESVNVPFIISGMDMNGKARTNNTHMVSTGLDILATMCDAAGIALPKGLEGISVLPLVTGSGVQSWRDHVIVENHMGRMVHMGNWKYMVGRELRHTDEECLHCEMYTGSYEPLVREMLIDLQTDPGEMRNRVDDREASEQLEKGRALLRERNERADYEPDKYYLI